jgi:nicotinamidase-related amidase
VQEKIMATESYDKSRTALLFVDPYNDFLSERGKLWPLVAAVAKEVRLLDNLRRIQAAVRKAGVRTIIVPHHRFAPNDFAGWVHATPYQLHALRELPFARGQWGGEWYEEFAPKAGDVIVQEHWGSSGFANTDLDFQLKQAGISHVILVGLLANTCIEATGRFASELGFHVTLVKDATAAGSADRMHAAHVHNGPTFAHRILTTEELLAALPTQ